MPNQPSKDTVTVSFTLPRALSKAVNDRAKRDLTNKSDIIRRALMSYLDDDTRASILDMLALEDEHTPAPKVEKPKATKKKN